MRSRSILPSRSSVALAFAFAIGAATSAQAVPSSSETVNDITIYRQLGYAFGLSNATPAGLFGAFGGGGGGGGGAGGFSGGTVPQFNLGSGGGNLPMAPGGGGGGAASAGGAAGGGAGGAGAGGAGAGGAGGAGGFGGMIIPPTPVLLPGAPIVEGGAQGGGGPSAQVGLAVQVPDVGVSTLGFGLTLAFFALAARRQSNVRRIASVMPSK